MIKKHYLLLGLIFLAAFLLRSFELKKILYFGPEQGRDFIKAQSIWANKDLILVGPKTDIDGIFHGPLYYYFLVFTNLFTQGNPEKTALCFSFINSLIVFPLFSLGKMLFDKKIGLISAILGAISFDLITTSQWLVQLSFLPLILSFFYLYLFKFLTGSKEALILLSFFYCLAFHLELILLFFLLIQFIFLTIFFKKQIIVRRKKILISLLLILFFLAPFIIFNIKNNFINFTALKKYQQEHSLYPNFSTTLSSLKVFLKIIFEIVNANLLNFRRDSIVQPLIILAALLWLFIKRRSKNAVFLASIIFLSLPIIFVTNSMLSSFFIGCGIGIIFLGGYLIAALTKKFNLKFLLPFSLLLSLSFYNSFNLIKAGNVFYQYSQKRTGFFIRDQRKLIKYILQKEENNNFSWQAFTMPYYCQESWDYLFSEMGYNLGSKEKKWVKKYLIIEPGTEEGSFLNSWLTQETKDTILLNERKFANIRLQERVVIEDGKDL